MVFRDFLSRKNQKILKSSKKIFDKKIFFFEKFSKKMPKKKFFFFIFAKKFFFLIFRKSCVKRLQPIMGHTNLQNSLLQFAIFLILWVLENFGLFKKMEIFDPLKKTFSNFFTQTVSDRLRFLMREKNHFGPRNDFPTSKSKKN